jgi:TP901 family phage tail tape measure protein
MANNGIIDQIVSQDAIASLEKLKKELAENSAAMTSLLQITKDIVIELQKVGTIKEITEVIEKQKKATTQLSAAEKERQRIIRTTEAAKAKLQQQNTKEAQELEQLRRKIIQNNTVLRNTAKENNAAAGSITQLRAQLNLATKAYDDMNKTMRESTAGQKAKADIKALHDEIMKLEHETGRSQRNVGNYFGAVKKGLLGIAGALGVATGINALINIFKSGYKTIARFEQANANLASILQTSIEGVRNLTEDAKRLGAETEYTAAQVTSLQTSLASLGFIENQILNMTESILKFATAVGAELGEAARMAGSVLRQFGLDSTKTEDTVATMAVATAKSALNFNFLDTAMQKVGIVAGQFGFKVEDTVALLGTLANVGMDASTAGTATRNILLNIANQSGDLARELGRPVKTLDDFVEGLKNLDEKNVSLAQTLELTDKRSVTAFQAFRNGAESIITLRDSITDAGDALDQMHKTRLNTVEGATKLLESAWEGLILAFSKSTGIFKLIIDTLTAFVNLLHRLVDWTGKNSKIILTATAAFVAYKIAVIIATAATKAHTAAVKINLALHKAGRSIMMLFGAAMSLMTGNIRGATYAWQIFSKSISISPVGIIAAAIAGAVVLFSSFTSEAEEAAKATERFNDEMDKEKSTINSIFDELKKANQGTVERLHLINQINSKYSQYLPQLLTEKSTLEEIVTAQKSVTMAMAENIAFKTQEEQIEKFQKKVSKANTNLFNEVDKLANRIENIGDRGAFKAKIKLEFEKSIENPDYIINKEEIIREYRELTSDRSVKVSWGFNNMWGRMREAINATQTLSTKTKDLKAEWQSYLETMFPGFKKVAEQSKEKVTLNVEIETARENIKQIEKQLAELRSGKEPEAMTGSFADAIEELEKKLSDAKKTLKTLTGEDEKTQKKEADEAQKKIDEVDKRIKSVQKKIVDMQFENITAPLKRVADNEENTLHQRLDALQEYYAEKLRLQDAQDAAELSTIDTAISEAQAQGNLELVKKLEEEKTAVVALNALERQKIENESQKKIAEIQEKEQKKQIETAKNAITEKQSTIESQQQAEENALLRQYTEGEINREKYEKRKIEIQLKYSQQSLQIEIDALKELLNIENLTEKERLKIKDEIHKLELKNESEHLEALEKLRDADIKKQEEELKKLEDAKKTLKQEAWNFAETLLSAQFERQIQKYDAEIEKINENKEAEIAALEQSGKTTEEIENDKMIIETRAEAQTKAIEQRKREAQTRQAKFEKALAVTKTTVEGARAFVAALPNYILAGIIAATTALQVASILAQPIPKYAKGTGDHPGGPAIVGDAYKHEIIIEPSGHTWLSEDHPAIIPNLPKHSVVLPSIDDGFAPNTKIFEGLHRINSIKEKAVEQTFNTAIEKQTKKLSNVIKESQSSMFVNLDSHGIYTISQKGKTFRKFTGNSLRHK